MIKINLLQCADLPNRNTRQPVAVMDTTITIGNDSYDLSLLPDGATATHPVLGQVSRDGDDYECSIKLPHGSSAPEETLFPEPVVLPDGFSGEVELPPYDAAEVTE